MKIKHLASNENMLRYALVATLLVFGLLYNNATRAKLRKPGGTLSVQVKHLESGNDFITGEEMRTRINNKFQTEFANKPLGSLSPIEMEAGLKSLDFVKSADVYVDANNTLNVLVTQREPILRIINHEGYSMYVDKDGTTMPPSLHYAPRVLVAYANVPNNLDTLKIAKEGIQKDLFTLTHLIREDRFLNILIEQISVDPHGEWTLVPKLGPSRILIGELDDMDEKIESIKKLYKKILPAEGWDKYSTVNLKFKGQVICTKRT